MAEIIFAYTKYNFSLQLVRYSPQHTVQDKSKTSTTRYNEARWGTHRRNQWLYR